jgi:hypothetical protein
VLIDARRVRYKPWRGYAVPLVIFAYIEANLGGVLFLLLEPPWADSASHPMVKVSLVSGLINAGFLAFILCVFALWRRRRAAHASIVTTTTPDLPEPPVGRPVGRKIWPRAGANWRTSMLAGAFLVVLGTLSYVIPEILETRTVLIRPASPAAEPAAHRLVQKFQSFYPLYLHSSLAFPTVQYIPPRGEAASFRQKFAVLLANGEVRDPPHRVLIEVSMIGGAPFVRLRNRPTLTSAKPCP